MFLKSHACIQLRVAVHVHMFICSCLSIETVMNRRISASSSRSAADDAEVSEGLCMYNLLPYQISGSRHRVPVTTKITTIFNIHTSC